MNSPSAYLLSAISYLLLAAAGDTFAWDDEDDSFGKANSTRRSSWIDYGYGQQQNSSAYQRHNSVIDLGGFKKADSLESTIHVQPISRPKSETIQQSIDRQNRELEEFTAQSQRQWEEQQARRAESRKEQEKQQAIYDEMNRRECEMAEFVGGVYKAKFGAVTGRDSAATTEGYIFRSGDSFVTPRGIYTKTGNVYAGPDGITTQTGDLFFGTKGTTIQSGGAFFTEGSSGYIVGPNCANKPAWRSR
ncbi:hypothetical protein EBZ02_08245 [bacterium]|nr:hypothetical protein [bacterium]